MQIPYPVFDAHANTIIGAKIFTDKMQEADNNVVRVLTLYKGYGNLGKEKNPKGLQQAQEVLVVYKKLSGGKYGR